MRPSIKCRLFILPLIGFGCATLPSRDTAAVPDEQDRQVLESALLVLSDAPHLHFASDDGTTIVLDNRSAKGTGMIRTGQLLADVGREYVIPSDIQANLLRRSEIPGSHESKSVAFDGLKFDKRIEVAALDDWLSIEDFEKSHPGARAYVIAWLPGYSDDGSQALVRAWIGPTAHGAMFTVLLEKRSNTWAAKWHHIAYFL